MERTHRELRARFANRLSSDDADGFTRVDERAAAEIAAVALGAEAVARVAGERRADLHHVDAEFVELVAGAFVEQRAGSKNNLVRIRVDDVGSRHAAEDAVAQSLNNFTAFNKGAHLNAAGRVAVVFHHHEILRNVDETTR